MSCYRFTALEVIQAPAVSKLFQPTRMLFLGSEWGEPRDLGTLKPRDKGFMHGCES